MPRRPAIPRKPPTPASLQAAALAHLARYAATEQGLLRVLLRRIDRWAREAEQDAEVVETITEEARREASGIVARLASSGAVSDAAFAESRTRSLSRAGRSRRAIGAHLAEKGVPQHLAASPDDPERELAAALIHARKRRMGPFRTKNHSPELERRELASLARAGFGHGTARQALAMDADEAEARIVAHRSAV